jgi:cobalamin biosynthesis protein CobD/CbiB
LPPSDVLRRAILWIAIVAFVVAQSGLLLVTVRRTAGRRQEVYGRFGLRLEAALSLLPALLTGVLLALAWHAVSASAP